MKTRGLLLAIMIIVVFIAGVGIGDWFATARHQSVLVRLEGANMILKSEIEKYVDVIHEIRSTAMQAMPMERVPEAPAASEKP